MEMDPNRFQSLWIAMLLQPFLFRDTSGCASRNITCGEIKNTDGFKFLHSCHNGSELQVESNETQLAHADFHKNTFDFLPEVVKMDKDSITTKHCRELKVKCIIEGPNNRISEICEEVNVMLEGNFLTHDMKNHHRELEEGPKPQRSHGSAAAAVVVLVVVVVVAMIFRTKEQSNQPRTGTVFCKDLVSCSCFRSVFSLQTSGIQDVEGQPNDRIENVAVLSGGDENENNHNIQLESDFRNQRDDPGATHQTKKTNTNRADGGPAVSDPNAEDQQDSTKQPLLSDQRAAGEGFGMAGEADVLVDKPGFDPDQVKGHSSVRDLGVESMCKENHNN